MEELIREYENILIGRNEDFSLECFEGIEPGGFNERISLSVFKYAMEYVMGWDENTAISRFDGYMLKKLKLSSLLRYIEFPSDFEDGDANYILSLIYPKKMRLNQKLLTEEILEDVVDGRRKQYPRGYFFGGTGFDRFCYCLKYILEVYHPVHDIEEVYKLFQTSGKSNIFDEFKLRIPIYQYGIDVMKAVHVITKDDTNGDLYYELYLFNKEFSEISSQKKKAAEKELGTS